MKRLFHLVLVLPALLLLGAVEDLNTSPVPGTAAKTTPFGRPSLGLDLGLEMAGPLSQPVLALRDGPKTEFERDRIEADTALRAREIELKYAATVDTAQIKAMMDRDREQQQAMQQQADPGAYQ